jgi:hypothetical protein
MGDRVVTWVVAPLKVNLRISAKGLVSKPKHHRRTRWHRGTLPVLAVLPAAGLAVVALAAPARAEDQPLSPVSPSAVQVDRSLTIVVDEPDPVVVSEVPVSPVQATPPLPVASEAAVETDAIEVPESPANAALSPTGSAGELAATAPLPAPEVAVISPREPARPLTPSPSARKPLKRSSRTRVEPQYQWPREQYHLATAPVGSRSEGAARAGETEPAPVSERFPSGPTIGEVSAPSKPAEYCVETPEDDQRNCPVDPDWKPSWNCNWIQGCILEVPLEEAFPEASDPGDSESPEVPECGATVPPGAQYQPTGGQYQPGSPDDPAVEDSVDEDASDSSDEVGCEEDSPNEAPAVPSPPQQPPVGPSSGSDVPLEQPAPTLTDAVEVPEPGSAELSSVPPPAAASGRSGTAVAPRAVGKVNVDDGWRLVVGGEREQVGAVLSATIEHEPQLHVDAHRQPSRQSTKTSSKPKPNPAMPRRAVPELPIKAVASPPVGSATDEPFADGLRLLALAMALFGLGLLGLALVGPSVRRDGNLLGQVAALARSKGLSRSATGVDGSDRLDERSAGIRYRD